MRLAPDFDSTLLKRCNTVNSKQMFNKFFADDWIQTADLCYRKRLLYQLSHNYLFGIVMVNWSTTLNGKKW